jgi:hypothetical protein
MFDFFSRKKQLQALPSIRRLIDATAPNRPQFIESELRRESRYSRTLPILLSPLENDLPILNASFAGVSQELSDSGFRLITFEKLTAAEYCASLWPRLSEAQSPLHVVCRPRESRQLTANMWSTGVQLIRLFQTENKLVFENLVRFARTYFRVP